MQLMCVGQREQMRLPINRLPSSSRPKMAWPVNEWILRTPFISIIQVEWITTLFKITLWFFLEDLLPTMFYVSTSLSVMTRLWNTMNHSQFF